jgi:hypothetical protein
MEAASVAVNASVNTKEAEQCLANALKTHQLSPIIRCTSLSSRKPSQSTSAFWHSVRICSNTGPT